MLNRGYHGWTAILVALLGLAPRPGRAVVQWTMIGCEGASVQGQSIDSIWDNAALMAANADSVLETLTGNNVIKALTTSSNLANNAKWMFGISVNFGGVLPSSSKNTLNNVVRPVYRQAKNLLQSNNGYLICSGAPALRGQVGTNANTWYYNIPGTQDVIALTSQPPGIRPCSPPSQGTPVTLGQTFNGKIYPLNADITTLPTGTATVILFCTELLDANNFKGTLASGFQANDPSADFPDPDKYRSASGTLLHEMIHAIDTGTYQDQGNDQVGDNIFPDSNAAYGFNRCALLAQTHQSNALVNPDGYRIFAEMCMSSNTRWGMPKPPQAATPAPGRKRSVIGRDAPRLSLGERRAAGPGGHVPGPLDSADAGAMRLDYLGHDLEWSAS